MKKLVLIAIITIALLIGTASAVLANDDITVIVNGHVLEFEQPPIFVDTRYFEQQILVPIREVMEALGADVFFHEPSQVAFVIRNELKIPLSIWLPPFDWYIVDSFECFMEGNYLERGIVQHPGTPLRVFNGSLIMPISGLVRAMGAEFSREGEGYRIIIIESPEELMVRNSDFAFFDDFVAYFEAEMKDDFEPIVPGPYVVYVIARLNTDYAEFDPFGGGVVKSSVEGSETFFPFIMARGGMFFMTNLRMGMQVGRHGPHYSTAMRIRFEYNHDADIEKLADSLTRPAELYLKDMHGGIFLDINDISHAFVRITDEESQIFAIELHLTEDGKHRLAEASEYISLRDASEERHLQFYLDDFAFGWMQIDGAEDFEYFESVLLDGFLNWTLVESIVDLIDIREIGRWEVEVQIEENSIFYIGGRRVD